MRWAQFIVIILFSSCTLWAQSPGDLVRQSAEYYSSLDSYQITGELKADIPDTTWTFLADAYAEDAGPRFQPAGASTPPVALQKVTNQRMVIRTASPGGGEPIPPRNVPFWWARVTQIAHFMKSAKDAGAETLTFEGKPEPCQIVEVNYEQPSPRGPIRWSTRFWISPAKHIVLKQQFLAGSQPLTWTFTLQSIAVNQPPSREFLEHANSGRVTSRSQWIGRPATDFALPDAKGNRVTLSKMMHRVVLLDFWATYCGPCRAELRMLQGMATQYREQGLEVWPITDDARDTAQRWMAKFGITQPSLFDPGRTVFQQYGINPIPAMVIVGRDGKIAAFFEGIQSEPDLRAAIEAALRVK
jgi:peroxiredoxin